MPPSYARRPVTRIEAIPLDQKSGDMLLAAEQQFAARLSAVADVAFAVAGVDPSDGWRLDPSIRMIARPVVVTPPVEAEVIDIPAAVTAPVVELAGQVLDAKNGNP